MHDSAVAARATTLGSAVFPRSLSMARWPPAVRRGRLMNRCCVLLEWECRCHGTRVLYKNRMRVN